MGDDNKENETLKTAFQSLLKNKSCDLRMLKKKKFTSQEIEECFIPLAKKALLREPEVALPGIAEFLEDMKASTDTFALDFLQGVASSLVSTSDDIRNYSVSSVSSIGRNITDGKILGSYLKQLFDLFKTNFSKVPQKTSISIAIAGVCKTSTKVTSFPEEVTEYFATALPTEKSESILRLLWAAFASWTLNADNLSSVAITVLKKGISGSGDTKSTAFRVAALLYDKYTSVEIDPEILNAASQVAVAAKKETTVSVDFIPAAALILRASVISGNPVDGSLLSTLSSAESINREKVYTSFAGEEGRVLVILVKRALLSSIRQPVTPYPNPILKLACVTLVFPNYIVRKFAQEAIEKLCIVEGSKLRTALIETMLKSLNTENDSVFDEVYNKASSKAGDRQEAKKVPSAFFAQVLSMLLPSKKSDFDSEEDSIRFLISALFLSSAPKVVEHQGAIWIHWVAKAVEYADLVHSDAFCDAVFDRILECGDKPLRSNVIRLLLSIHFKNSQGDDTGSYISNKFWKRFSKEIFSIDKAKYLEVTEKSAGIFKTKEGELYNIAVIDEASDLNLEKTKVKRENKAYSIKEQLAEIELRKELARKNREAGKLTEKQKAAVNKELKEESEVRKQMAELYHPVEITFSILAEAARYNPKGACFYVDVLYEVVVPLLKSHLVSSIAAETFLAFSDAFFEPSTDSLGALVGTAALRVLGSLGYADVHWVESLVDQLTRVFNSLASLCIVIDIPMDDLTLEEDNWQDMMSAWKLSFLVPVIEKILPSQYPMEFKLKVSNFLRSAVNGSFLSSEDVALPPIARLHRFLIQQICADPGSEIFEDLKQTVTNYCTLIQEVEEPTESIKTFFYDVMNVLDDKTEMLRIMALKWLTSDDSYLLKQMASDHEFKQKLMVALFLERFDPDENCAEVAMSLWTILRFTESLSMGDGIFNVTTHSHEFIQTEAAESVKELCECFPEFVDNCFKKLFEIYDQYLNIIPPVLDNVGRVVKEGRDPVVERVGVGKSLISLAEILPIEKTQEFIEEIVSRLNERDSTAHSVLRTAAVTAIKRHGKQLMGSLLPFLEEKLNQAPTTVEGDHLRQGLVVLIGTLGMYLGNQQDKVLKIFKALIETLSTPSESVQKSVAECLPQLVGFLENDSAETLENLLYIMEAATSYGERRGAAYGIAAIISGLRAYIIVEMGLQKRIENMVTSKSNHHQRESALLIMELLFSLMGHSSEPFMPGFIPLLLTTYGDSNEAVRQAAADAGQALMAALSQHGAKLIVPLILKSTENDNWRTKRAAAELLGAVSQCAPKQLSSCLPKVVPTLVELLADSHHEVQKAGTRALKEIAKVIRNPEIMSIAPHLINGLTDPVSKTSSALETVVNTRFIHYMDPPSLALIMPIVKRAFGERNTNPRLMSSQIIANIYTLTDKRDMEPYLTIIIPGLQSALLDPVPEVRTVAARAFGAVLKYSAENIRNQVAQQLVPWLKQKLVSQSSMVDRSGAAQGLAEAIAAFGEEYLDATMPELLAVAENSKTNPFTRDGHLLLFIYLPIVLRDRFVNYLSAVVSPLLVSLADENEIVRNTALKAGQQLITLYVGNARTTLLPQLQKGLFHENWRIRHAAVQLIGDYLFNISGVSGKMSSATTNEDDTLGIEMINKAIIQNLGRQARDEILSGLYLCRQDVALVVRQAASHVWKVVVPNTPRALRDIMENLFDMLLKCLASSSKERQQTAARCLGEVVKKMGERLLNTILPILRNNLETDVIEQRLGVAEALNEVLQNCSKESLSTNTGSLMVILNKCLSDSSSAVRAAAASPFNLLMQIVGQSAVDEIIVPMVDKFLKTSDLDTLDALCMIVNVNPRVFLPPILSKLKRPPVNTLGLCRIAAASGGSALNKYLPDILTPILESKPKKNEMETFVNNCLPALNAITEAHTMESAVNKLLSATEKNNNPVGIYLLKNWVENSKNLFEEEVVEGILPNALGLYAHEDEEIVDQAISVVEGIIKNTKQGNSIEYVHGIKSAMERLDNDKNEIKVLGFHKASGFAAFQQVLKEAFFSGSNVQKESAINISRVFAKVANTAGLGPHAVFLAGPLIRSLGDRFLGVTRKSALIALKYLFEKVSTNIRPFVPQIHTELLKLMQVENLLPMKQVFSEVLGHAICNHMKSEVVFNDLVQFLVAAEDPKVLELGFLTLEQVIPQKKDSYSKETIQKVVAVARSNVKSSNETISASATAIVNQLP
ncbi:hypothetical protein FO519_006979 [Halicephalobus sp. NKZ332]|nr:hypothetical protein FO519_006979 [Halicephalobus sp. NKZ332]